MVTFLIMRTLGSPMAVARSLFGGRDTAWAAIRWGNVFGDLLAHTDPPFHPVAELSIE